MFRQLLVLSVLFGLTTAAIAQDEGAAAQPAGQADRSEAQERGGRGDREDRGDRGERGDRRNFDPAQVRQRMMDALKEQLKPTDEEWQVLQPAIEKTMTAQRNNRSGWGGFGRGRGGPDASAQPETEVARASRDLRTSLQNESATPQEIGEKLKAYRAAREKADAELTTARAELRELVTQRQEAVLVMMGILE